MAMEPQSGQQPMVTHRTERLYAIKASYAKELTTARNTLTQRVQGPLSTGTVEMDASGLKDGNIAGFGVFQDPYAYVAVRQGDGIRKLIFCYKGKQTTIIENLKQDKVWFRARVTDKDFTARLYYSLNGKDFSPVGEVLHMDLGYPWTANRFALLNYSETYEGIGALPILTGSDFIINNYYDS